MLDRDSLSILREAVDRLDAGFDSLPAFEPDFDRESVCAVILEAADRLHDNFPYPHPLYAGQMLKPPHPVARIAYQLAQYINPNNHALDGGRASSEMEKEAVAGIAGMFGWGTTPGTQHDQLRVTGGTVTLDQARQRNGRIIRPRLEGTLGFNPANVVSTSVPCEPIIDGGETIYLRKCPSLPRTPQARWPATARAH